MYLSNKYPIKRILDELEEKMLIKMNLVAKELTQQFFSLDK